VGVVVVAVVVVVIAVAAVQPVHALFVSRLASQQRALFYKPLTLSLNRESLFSTLLGSEAP